MHSSASAATLTLTTGIDPTLHTGATLIRNAGEYVVAANVGGTTAGGSTDVTVDGTVFLIGPLDSTAGSVTDNGVTIAWTTDLVGDGSGGGAVEGARGADVAAYSAAGDTSLGALMGDHLVSGRTESGNPDSDMRVTISGLTDGQEYRAQLLMDQVGVGGQFRDFTDLTDGTESTGSFMVGNPGGGSAIYKFVADNTGEVNLTLDGNEGGAFVRTVLNAVSVYAVPEPSSFLIGVLTIGCLAIRQRVK